MRALDVFLVPGKAVLDLVFLIFQFTPAADHALLFTIVAGVISWLIWIVCIKTVWFITLRLLGFA